jgi:hypothetical protein
MNDARRDTASLSRLADSMMAQFRMDALECGASGALADPEIAAKWLELFEAYDPPFAAKFKRLLENPTEPVFMAELLREIAASDPQRLYPAVSGLDGNA